MLSPSIKHFVNIIEHLKERFGFVVFLFLLVLLTYLSGMRVDISSQAYISIYLLTLLLLLRSEKGFGFWHVLFVVLSSFIVLRYFSWRISYTLISEDIVSYICTIALFLAELYGGLMFFLSIFVNIYPLERKSVNLPEDRSLWPTVDIIIPSYNEPFELVKITLASARNIDYPLEKLNIYLLDDGGTLEKLNSSKVASQKETLYRSQQFQGYCAELNITYLTRKNNSHAKAGNMNNALKYIKGDLILILDADHIPSVDILKKTVGSFIKDEKVFLVQTPHFFINPDPFEKNLGLFNHMPAESDMFYKAIQKGLDFWQASFFCGSAAILRRKAIDEIGGFSGMTITEDSETTIKLHSKGWKSHYIFHPLISGLQPETFDSFIIQRMRWAQGMVQNFIFNNPLLMPNLKLGQRICYLSSMLFWFFPIARVIFLIAPGLYLLFGLKIYHANVIEFFSYTVPFLFALILTDHFIFSEVRWVFISEIYETMQSLFSLGAVLSAIKNPHKPTFSVTPKMEMLQKDYISPLSKPFYWALLYTLLSIGFGVARYINYPEEHFIVMFTSFWAFYNLLLLMATLGALYEHRQRRLNPRIPVQIKANWYIKPSAISTHETRIPLTINDLSIGGSNLLSPSELPIQDNQLAYLEVQNNDDNSKHYFDVSILGKTYKKDHFIYNVKFNYANLNEYINIVRFIHGDSARWIKIYQDTSNNPGLISSSLFMVKTGFHYGVSHIYIVLTYFFKKLVDVYV